MPVKQIKTARIVWYYKCY